MNVLVPQDSTNCYCKLLVKCNLLEKRIIIKHLKKKKSFREVDGHSILIWAGPAPQQNSLPEAIPTPALETL